MTRSESHWNRIESRLGRFAWPAIGEKPLGSVRAADLLAIIEVPSAEHHRLLTPTEN